MMRIRTISLLFSFLFIILPGCSSGLQRDFQIDAANKNEFLTIWALSDIQPKIMSHRWHFEEAVRDVNTNIKYIDLAIVAGDIVNFKNSADVYKWYIRTKDKTSFKYWYEIAGNHDQKDIYNYKKYIGKPLHYSVAIGNILILLMSDEDRFPAQYISDETFEWWKDLVIRNQDKIIITVTHAYLEESRLFGYSIASRNIKNSKRFADVLRKYRVDIWICGHTHLPNFFRMKWSIVDELNGTLFLNVTTIRKDIINSITSNVLVFKKNSDYAAIKWRYHEQRRWNDRSELYHKLKHKFEWDGSPPVASYEKQ